MSAALDRFTEIRAQEAALLKIEQAATEAARLALGVEYVDRRGPGYVEHHRKCRTCGGSNRLPVEGPRRTIVSLRDPGWPRTITMPSPTVRCTDCNHHGWQVCADPDGCAHPDLHGGSR